MIITNSFAIMIRKIKLHTSILLFSCFIATAGEPKSLKFDWNKPKPFFQFESSNVLFDKLDHTNGFSGGLEFGKKYRFSIGFHKTKPDLIEIKIVNAQDAANTIYGDPAVLTTIKMWTIPLGIEYIFLNKEPYQISASANLGLGESYFNYRDKSGKSHKLNNHFAANTEVSVAAQYIILKWFGVGASIGYRLMLINNHSINHNFNSPLYQFGIKVFPGEIYHSLFPSGI